MKILFVNKFLYPRGGSENYMFELAELLRRQGAMIGFWGMDDDKNVVPDEYGAFARNVDYASPGGIKDRIKTCFSSIYSRENRNRISMVMKKFRPDIVHIHNYNFQLTPAILPRIKEFGARVVHTMHDSQLVCPCHRLYNFQKKSICCDCAKGGFWRCAASRCFDGSLLKSLLGAAESYFYHSRDYYTRHIDAFISPSKFLACRVAPSVRKKVYVVPNFVHDRSDPRAVAGRAQDYVLYFGRISWGKGIIEAQEFFSRQGIKLLVIGSGPQQDLISRSGPIEYLGPRHGEELFRYISRAKFVIQPAREPENCPMTVIESFMCSTPVIASPKGGLTEMIQNGINGFLVDFEDPAGLSCLSRILRMDTTRMRLLCRKTYLEKYSPQQHLAKINLIYGRVLNPGLS